MVKEMVIVMAMVTMVIVIVAAMEVGTLVMIRCDESLSKALACSFKMSAT